MMNDNTRRGLLVAGLSANVLFLALALIDYARFDSEYMWPIFVGWAVLVILLVLLALATFGIRSPETATPALARAVASLAARPSVPPPSAPPAPKPEPVVTTLEPFPFTYNGYTLYTRKVALKGGGERSIWFFSKRRPASGEQAAKPAGFHVGVNERTGLPFLKKGSGKDGEDLTPHAEPALRPQCGALTADGKQCRNSSRADSKYCASHFGYQPRTLRGAAKAIEGDSWSASDKVTDRQTLDRADTKGRVKGAKDTAPSVRKRSAT